MRSKNWMCKRIHCNKTCPIWENCKGFRETVEEWKSRNSKCGRTTKGLRPNFYV